MVVLRACLPVFDGFFSVAAVVTTYHNLILCVSPAVEHPPVAVGIWFFLMKFNYTSVCKFTPYTQHTQFHSLKRISVAALLTNNLDGLLVECKKMQVEM